MDVGKCLLRRARDGLNDRREPHDLINERQKRKTNDRPTDQLTEGKEGRKETRSDVKRVYWSRLLSSCLADKAF
jgi:hypothetical protein